MEVKGVRVYKKKKKNILKVNWILIEVLKTYKCISPPTQTQLMLSDRF